MIVLLSEQSHLAFLPYTQKIELPCAVMYNKQYQRKVHEILSSFHLSGYTIGFQSQTQKLELHTE